MDVLDRPLTRRHAAVLLVTAVALGASGCAVGGAAAPAPSRDAAAPSSSSSPALVAARAGAVVPEPPVSIELPDGDRVPIRSVGTTANGLLDVPSDIGEAGWWSGGSRIGDPFGSTLVAAHVDSTTQGLGPFASLLTVRAGDRVVVWSEGLRQGFRVKSLWLRPRGAIGDGSWLHSPDGDRRLVLVTCAGPYDAAQGGYQNLAVIVAEPQGKAEPRT